MLKVRSSVQVQSGCFTNLFSLFTYFSAKFSLGEHRGGVSWNFGIPFCLFGTFVDLRRDASSKAGRIRDEWMRAISVLFSFFLFSFFFFFCYRHWLGRLKYSRRICGRGWILANHTTGFSDISNSLMQIRFRRWDYSNSIFSFSVFRSCAWLRYI